MNFLAAHDCRADFREFRATPSSEKVALSVAPVVLSGHAGQAESIEQDPAYAHDALRTTGAGFPADASLAAA